MPTVIRYDRMRTSVRRGIIALACLSVSLSAIFARYAETPSMTLVFYRMLFASLLMIPFVVWRCRSELKGLRASDALWCIVSGIALALHFYTFFESLNHTSVASSLVLVDTSVFFVAFIMLFLFRERIPKAGWAAMALTFLGSVVISMDDFAGGALYGDMLALAGSLLFAVYAVIGRRERAGMSALTYTFIVYVSAAVTALILTETTGVGIAGTDADGLLCALGMAVFCTLLGHSVFSWGLKYEKASFIAVTSLLEPVFGSILALILFSENPSVTVLIGSITVLVGVYIFSANTEPEKAH